MDLPTPLVVLRELGPERVQAIIRALHINGILFDESGLGLSSGVIERWSHECEEFLRWAGYKGGRIRTGGRFFEAYGAIYMLYDTDALAYEAAREALDQFGANQARAYTKNWNKSQAIP